MSDNTDHASFIKTMISGIIVTIIGGAILAVIVGEGRFAPKSEPTSTPVSIRQQQQPTVTPSFRIGQQQKQEGTSTVVTPFVKINPTPTPVSKPLSQAIAVLIVNDQRGIEWTLSSQIQSILKRKGKNVTTPALFTQNFVANGQFDRLFQGDTHEAQRLQVQYHFKSAILGKKTVSFVENSDLENMITATVKLEVHVVSSVSGTIQESILLSAKGPGFSQDDAEKIAIERILEDAVGRL